MGWILILLVVFIFLFVYTIKYFKLNKVYTEVKKKCDNIEDADQYVQRVRSSADLYAKETRSDANNHVKQSEKQVAELEKTISDLNNQKKALSSDLRDLEKELFVEIVKIDEYDGLKSDEVKNNLALLRGKQEEMEKSGNAVSSWYAPSDRSAKRAQENQKKQILRCFKSECKGIIENVTVKNVDTSRAKIQRSFDAINKIFQTDSVAITRDYLATKFEELSLVYAYMVKQAEEAEQRKAIREQMVEEEKVRREIEREKQKLEKEETQFKNEENKLMSYLQKSKDDVERQLYMDKIKELQERISQLQADKENVLQREQNTRAGFVYIISNIGSFGDDVYKIGMTRRLDPMDRIAELSSASVPFAFDVHALIFSEDAPSLETTLHQYFAEKRVNKVNARKEFFRVDLEEIKTVVKQNHNATVKFIDIPDADEYRETLKMESNV